MTPQEIATIQYRREFIPEFELRKSLLRMSVTTEYMREGNSARFLISGGKGHKAKTRGSNGKIPARQPNNETVPIPLTEEWDLQEMTGFDIFSAQGDQRAIMQYGSIGVMNRRYDEQILDALATATIATDAPSTDVFAIARKAKAILGQNRVAFDGRITAVITPAFEAELFGVKEFGSADWVNVKPLDGAHAEESGYGYHRWLGVNWIVHPELATAGTADEHCYMYHANAMGHAADSSDMKVRMGFDEKQDESWVNAGAFCGAGKLQNDGLVVMRHDGSGYQPNTI